MKALLHVVNWNSESYSFNNSPIWRGENRGVHTDDSTVRIQQRPTAIAWIDGRISLQVVEALGRHDAACDRWRSLQDLAQRIAHRDDVFTYLGGCRVTQLQRSWVDAIGQANAGQIQVWVNTDYGTDMCSTIDEFKKNLGMALYNVSIGNHMAVGVSNKSGPCVVRGGYTYQACFGMSNYLRQGRCVWVRRFHCQRSLQAWSHRLLERRTKPTDP